MKRELAVLGLTAALAGGMTACGSNGASPSAHGAGAGATAKPSVDCSDPTHLSQAQYVQHCAGRANVPTADVGKAYVSTNPKDGSKQAVTVTSMSCGGTKPLKTDMGPPDKPQPGKVFCVVRGTVKNVGSKPVQAMVNLPVITAGGKQYADTLDDGYAAEVLSPHALVPDFMLDSPLNPGDSRPWLMVYQVPRSVHPSSLDVQDDTGVLVAHLALPR